MSGHRLRILVFAPRSKYINPSEEEFFSALSQQCDVYFHGPGFVPMETLENDATAVFEKSGPFDAAILHQYFLLDSILEASNSCSFYFNVRKFRSLFAGFPRNFSKLPCVKIAPFQRMDYYAITPEMVAVMNDFPGYYLTWPAEFVPSVKQLKDLDREAFVTAPSDNYHDFAQANRHRIIPYMHTIGDDLFSPPDPNQNKWPVFVPGQLYAARHDALKRLKSAGYEVNNHSRDVGLLSRIVSIVSGKPLFAHRWAIEYLQKRFRSQIRRSLVCYTDGSRLRWPIRKYFEIPAFGSLLVCDPFHRAEDLGFVDGRNFVAAAPDDLPHIVRRAMSDNEWAYQMITSSQQMIRSRHSSSVRATQFLQALKMVVGGTYRGARWERGLLVFDGHDADT